MNNAKLARRLSAISLAVAGALPAVVPIQAHAWVMNAHFWVSTGIFSRFNVVTKEDFSAKQSDMQCGFAAGRDVYLKSGYTVGQSGIVSTTNTHPNAALGLLIGRNLDWSEHPSGTIAGDVFLGGSANVTIASDASVTLAPGKAIHAISGNDLFQAITPELWVGWGNDTANWGNGNLTPNNSAPGASGWTGHTSQNLPGFFSIFFDQYLTNMANSTLLTAANGPTDVQSWYNDANGNARKNIMLDAGNKGRCDMPGNAGNCSATGGPNGQPGGRRAVYIFDVNATDLSHADEVRIKNVRETDEFGSPTWTVIKVKANGATSATLGNMGLQDFAPRNTRTLWVFDPAITTININGVAIEGTILAPKANVVANNGHINGSILANSFQGTLEGHCAPFENYIDP